MLQSIRQSSGLRKYLILLLLYLFLVGGVVISSVSPFGRTVVKIALFGVAVVGLFGSIYYWHLFFKSKKVLLLALKDAPQNRNQSYTFTDEFFQVDGSVKSEDGPVRITWDRLKRVEDYQDVWHLDFQSVPENVQVDRYLLPSKQIDEELVAFLKSKAKTQEVGIYQEQQFPLVVKFATIRANPRSGFANSGRASLLIKRTL